MKKSVLTIVGTMFMLSTYCSSAIAISIYTDRVLWESSISLPVDEGVVTESFNVSSTLPIYDGSETSIGIFSIYDSSSLSPNRVENYSGSIYPNFQDDWLGLAVDSSGLELRFDNPISYFGADFAAVRNGADLTLGGTGFFGINIDDLLGSSNSGFVGVTFDSPLSTLTLSIIRPPTDLDAIGLDNVSFNAPILASVPLPPTLWLVGSGFIGLLIARRRMA